MAQLFRPFRKIQVTDQNLSRLQDNLVDTFDSLALCRMLGVRTMLAVPLVTGINRLSHGLGRPYVSWWLGNPDTSVLVRALIDTVSNPDRSKYLVLQASAPYIPDVFVL